jgi:hypothetical protein
VLNTSSPLFNLKTDFTNSKVAAGQDSFKVQLKLKMPKPATDYPVRLVVVRQDSGEPIAIKEGMASKVLAMTLDTHDLGEVVKDVR